MKVKSFFVLITILFAISSLGLLSIFTLNWSWISEGFVDREIEEIQSFNELWSMPINLQIVDVVNEYERTPNVFVSVYDETVVYRTNDLIGVDKYTGEVVWNEDVQPTHQISSDDSKIFLINHTNNPNLATSKRCDPNLPICEAINITAFDANSGTFLWANSYANMFHVNKFFSSDDTANLLGIGSHGAYISEINISIDSGEELFFLQDPPYFSSSAQAGIRFNERLMEKKLGREPYDIINVVSTDTYSVFLTQSDSSLWAIDNNSYEVIGKVEFSGGPFVFGDVNKFDLDADDNVVVVYLGDSSQLFVFNFDPPE